MIELLCRLKYLMRAHKIEVHSSKPWNLIHEVLKELNSEGKI